MRAPGPADRLFATLMISLLATGIAGDVWSQGRGPGSQTTPRLMRGSAPARVKKVVRPPEAYDLSIRGEAMVRCRIDKTRLTGCEAESETPAGMGFGAAGARSLERQRLNRWVMDGHADGDIVYLPVEIGPGIVSARPPVDTADWRQAPTFEQVEAAWPAVAGDLATGAAALRCTVDAEGALGACAIAGEVPAHSAFGEAALTLAPLFRVDPTPDGRAPNPAYDVLVSFRFHNPSTPAGRMRQIDKPDWIDSPSRPQIMEAFPAEAKAAGVTVGVGVVVCQVSMRGTLVDCEATQEAPERLGFGQAALAVAGSMRLALWTPQGRPVRGGKIRFAVRFPPTPMYPPRKSKTTDGSPD